MTERRSEKILNYTELHERMKGVETKTDTILTNHLPHIEQAIRDLDAKTTKQVDGLGTRFDLSISQLGDRMEKKQEKIDTKFWAIISLLIATLVGVVVTLTVKH